MGMYTELNISVCLEGDTPKNVIDILKFMLKDNPFEPTEKPNHELFTNDTRWRFMLTSDSYYFDGHTDSSMVYDHIGENYSLNVRCNLKNYDDEINLFLDFISPYLETEGFLGYTRYEEAEHPILIYNDYGTIIYK